MARSPAASQSDASAKTSKRPKTKRKPKKKKTGKRPQCKGKTKAGKRCTNRAKQGSDCCSSHSGTVGRPTKFTPETQAKCILLAQQANFKKQICEGAGIDQSTLAAWLERGEADEAENIDSAYSGFSRAFRRGIAEGEIRLVARLQLQSQEGSVRATLELLKRRYKENWGDNVKVEVETDRPSTGDSSLDPEKLSVDQRLALAELLEAAAPDPPKETP